MEQTRLFSPVVDGLGLKPEEYMLKYPELSKRAETKNLRGIENIWCWYYASEDSPFVIEGMNHEEKCEQITKFVFGKINKGRSYEEEKAAKIKNGFIPAEWARAIDFFKTRDKEVRTRAKTILDKMFDEYEGIVEKGIGGFPDKDGGYDYNKYTVTMKRISEELPELIKKKEEGYGITEHIGFSDTQTEGDYFNNLYLKTKG